MSSGMLGTCTGIGTLTASVNGRGFVAEMGVIAHFSGGFCEHLDSSAGSGRQMHRPYWRGAIRGLSGRGPAVQWLKLNGAFCTLVRWGTGALVHGPGRVGVGPGLALGGECGGGIGDGAVDAVSGDGDPVRAGPDPRPRSHCAKVERGTGAELQDVGHGDEHEDSFAGGLPDTGDGGPDGCGENPTELDVAAMGWLMGRRSSCCFS